MSQLQYVRESFSRLDEFSVALNNSSSLETFIKKYTEISNSDGNETK